jgi:hypothetical protein
MRTHYVHDYETLSNCFVAIFEDYKTDDRKIFVVHQLRNDFKELIEFLIKNRDNNERHISFNGIAFDSQITEYLLKNRNKFLKSDAELIAKSIYSKAQSIIEKQNKGEFPEIQESKLSIKQIDVFKLNHWDNPAKRSSLKFIQYSMNWHNILEMPIDHTTNIETLEQIEIIINYCINDVVSTKKIYEKSKELIKLRKSLTEEYNINLYSASEPKISKELFLYFLNKQTNISKFELKQLNTSRTNIKVSDIILPYIKFEQPEFIKLLEECRKLNIDPNNIKGSFKHVLTYKGVKTEYGLGGIHGATNSGIYKASNDMIIMSSDVTSFYPNLAIRNKWAPAHLPKKEFCDLYEWIFEERKKIPKKDPKNYVYKIILNATYGLSIDPTSFLYDPQFGMQITINGQLLLTKLYEMITMAIPESISLMQNTDGLEIMIPRDKKDVYMQVCKEWENLTQLELEHDEYQKLILADVNNYIGVFKYRVVSKEAYLELKEKNPDDLFKISKGIFYYAPAKCKGRFEYKDLALHKNKSKLVIPKALFKYFIHNVSPAKYLETNKDIFDYCIGVRIKGEWQFNRTCIIDREISYEKLQNTLRYYVSTDGCKIVKRNINDNREIQLESGEWMQTLFNKYEEMEFSNYNINTKYYLQAIEKEIENIEPKQTIQLAIDYFK